MGKIKCPPEYPAKAPHIILLHENGRFHTWDEGICLSISHYHPESWNPVWKVNQVVIGLTSFWQTTEGTYGGVYDHELQNLCKKNESKSDCIIRLAKESREKVLKHPKWSIFEPYAAAIGIDKVPEIEGWAEHEERNAKRVAAEEKAKRAAEEAKRIAEEKKRAKEAKELVAKAAKI